MKLRSFAIVLALVLSGCCTCRDRYKPALDQWTSNLEQLRPTMLAGAKLLPTPDLTESKMGLYDRTVQGIKRVNGQGPEVWNTPVAETATDEATTEREVGDE